MELTVCILVEIPKTKQMSQHKNYKILQTKKKMNT